MEWKEVRLGDVCTKITDGSHFSPKAQTEGYPMLSVKDMREYDFDFSNCKKISYEDYLKMERDGCVPQIGDVLVAKDGSYLKEIFICKEQREIALLSSIAIFRPNSQLIDSRFLCYCLKSPRVYNYISLNCVSGSALPRIILKDFKGVNIKVPSLDDQRRIASILSSLDRKIELNNKINADLEEMAQAIFKNWFVDFEPFKNGKFVVSELGMIPEGWKVGTLGEFCKCLLGGTPSRSKEEYWNGEVNWINSGEINKFRILEASEKITELGLAKSATKLLPKKTTVLAITGATLGQVSLLEIDTCANQSVIGVLENTEVPYEYIYPFIKDRIEMLIQHQTGGAQQHINKDNVESLIFLLPAINVLEDYISLVSPMYKRIESLCFENLYLSTLRDTLLPRLMSGELEVPE